MRWGGGTRIGQSLAEFVHEKGARCLSDETVTIIYSDGLDVGEVRQLERAMHEFYRRSACVIWVNPLVGTPGYAPEAKGMRASLPFIALHWTAFADEASVQSTTLVSPVKQVSMTVAAPCTIAFFGSMARARSEMPRRTRIARERALK